MWACDKGFYCQGFQLLLCYSLQACIECCKQLVQIDPDVLWLKLCSVYTPRAYLPPDNRFLDIKVRLE